MYQNIEAEQATLGACLIDKDAFTTIVETLVPEDFDLQKHRTIYEAMLKLLEQSIDIDIVTVTTQLHNDQKIGNIGTSYLTELINSVPTPKNIEYYNNIIKKSSIKRKQWELLKSIESGTIEIEQALIELEKLPQILIKEETLQSILENTLRNTLKGTDFTFAISALNKYLGGLDKGELLTIGGYTSQAKSSLAIQLAIDMAKKGKKVLFLSTEMTPIEIGRRILGNIGSINIMDLRRGMLNEVERQSLELLSQRIGEDWAMNIKKVYSIADVHKYIRKYTPDILFLDYIQNLSGIADYKTATNNIKELQSLTLHGSIATICTSQLSRNKEETREPRLSDLRDTGRIEECSNIVLFIYWRERLKEENKPRVGGEPPEQIDILICKNRDGSIGRTTLDFYPEYSRIEDPMGKCGQETIF